MNIDKLDKEEKKIKEYRLTIEPVDGRFNPLVKEYGYDPAVVVCEAVILSIKAEAKEETRMKLIIDAVEQVGSGFRSVKVEAVFDDDLTE